MNAYQNRAIAISLAALILTICCLCGNKVVLSNQYGLDKIDIYNLDSLITLLNKNVVKIKLDPTLDVNSYDSSYTSKGVKMRRMLLQTRKSEKLLSLDIRSDTIHRITVFSDKVSSNRRPVVGQAFSKVKGVLPYLSTTIDGSVDLLDSVDYRIVYHFESLHGTASINETNFVFSGQGMTVISFQNRAIAISSAVLALTKSSLIVSACDTIPPE